jgi:hypothetical protein
MIVIGTSSNEDVRDISFTHPIMLLLRERLAAYPALTAVRLWRELKERGFAGGTSVVRDRVREPRPSRPAGFRVRFETPAGEQAQESAPCAANAYRMWSKPSVGLIFAVRAHTVRRKLPRMAPRYLVDAFRCI